MSRNILIIEDEIIIAENMRLMIAEFPGFSNPVVACTLPEANEFLSRQKPDLVLLDIRLGEGNNGIEFANKLNQLNVPFLFITSHADASTVGQAILKKPIGYLVKPVNRQNLFVQLELVFDKMKPANYFIFKSGTHQVRLDENQIVYLKSDNVYTELYTTELRYVIRNSMKNILDEINLEFIQIHRSYFVNPAFIRELNNSVYLTDGRVLPLSRTYKNNVLKTVFKDL